MHRGLFQHHCGKAVMLQQHSCRADEAVPLPDFQYSIFKDLRGTGRLGLLDFVGRACPGYQDESRSATTSTPGWLPGSAIT